MATDKNIVLYFDWKLHNILIFVIFLWIRRHRTGSIWYDRNTGYRGRARLLHIFDRKVVLGLLRRYAALNTIKDMNIADFKRNYAISWRLYTSYSRRIFVDYSLCTNPPQRHIYQTEGVAPSWSHGAARAYRGFRNLAAGTVMGVYIIIEYSVSFGNVTFV